jgi:hypothetical protein
MPITAYYGPTTPCPETRTSSGHEILNRGSENLALEKMRNAAPFVKC